MRKVYYRQTPHEARSFLDDLGLKGPKNQYNDEEIAPEIRKFVLEHVQTFKRFIHSTWMTDLMISGTKCDIDVPRITIVDMICDYMEDIRSKRRSQRSLLDSFYDWQRTFEYFSILLCIIESSLSRSRGVEGRHSRTWVDRIKIDSTKQRWRIMIKTNSLI